MEVNSSRFSPRDQEWRTDYHWRGSHLLALAKAYRSLHNSGSLRAGSRWSTDLERAAASAKLSGEAARRKSAFLFATRARASKVSLVAGYNSGLSKNTGRVFKSLR